jgi:pimeloyl-ACP methyl ester carboxylesterase
MNSSPLPHRTVMLDLGRTSIRVMTCGHGAPVLLVHGLAGSTAWWVRNVDVLGRHHAVYLIDLPGFGSMRKYAKQFSVAGSVQWLAHVLSALNLHQTGLVGHSMGGLIAAMFAAKYPDKVMNLVLAAPAIALPHKSVLPLLVPLMKEATYVQPAFLPTLVRDTARAGLLTLIGASRELLTRDIKKELSSIAARCLLMYGEHDRLVPVSLGTKLQSQIPGSCLSVLPRAGHILMYDRADLFNKALIRFLSGLAPITSGNR